MNMNYYILKKQNTDLADFVEFWAELYNDKYEPIYREYIGQPLTPKSVKALLSWKALLITKKSIEDGNHPFVKALIADLDHLQSIQCNLLTSEDADKFLTTELKGKGMIWKIFTLHILHPEKYPIFDQHVYRSMVYLKTGKIEEISKNPEEKQLKYINEYLPFYNEHGYYEDRKLDKALFSFGQILKTRLGRSSMQTEIQI